MHKRLEKEQKNLAGEKPLEYCCVDHCCHCCLSGFPAFGTGLVVSGPCKGGTLLKVCMWVHFSYMVGNGILNWIWVNFQPEEFPWKLGQSTFVLINTKYHSVMKCIFGILDQYQLIMMTYIPVCSFGRSPPPPPPLHKSLVPRRNTSYPDHNYHNSLFPEMMDDVLRGEGVNKCWKYWSADLCHFLEISVLN